MILIYNIIKLVMCQELIHKQ